MKYRVVIYDTTGRLVRGDSDELTDNEVAGLLEALRDLMSLDYFSIPCDGIEVHYNVDNIVSVYLEEVE